MEDKKPLNAFPDYYEMMISVIHGVVLAVAAESFADFFNVDSNALLFYDKFWFILRWVASILLTMVLAWKYLSGATYASWQIDILDLTIPSLLGVFLSISFLYAADPLFWIRSMFGYSILAASAFVRLLNKNKFAASEKGEIYYQNAKMSTVCAVGAVPILFFLTLVPTDWITLTAFFPLACAIYLLYLDIKAWKKLSCLDDVYQERGELG